VFYLKPLYEAGGAAVVALIAAGGLLYTLGAVVYGTKRPNPSPRWFGFHEIFHVLTVAAFVVHYIAVSMAVYAAPPV
jgi:hemolysin III